MKLIKVEIINQKKLPRWFKKARVSYLLRTIHCKDTAIAAAVGISAMYKQQLGKKGSLGIYLYEFQPVLGVHSSMWQICEVQSLTDND